MNKTKTRNRRSLKSAGAGAGADAGAPSQRPKRVAKRNRQFLDREIWANSSLSSVPSTITSPPKTSTPKSSKPLITISAPTTNNGTDHELGFIPPLPSTQKIPVKIVRNRKKPKNFIRFRFQIDCKAAVGVNVDALVKFLKNNMKIEGKKNNLAGVTIERRNSNIHIMSKVMLKKKYLKDLSKKYLRKEKKYDFHVLSMKSVHTKYF